ncbi:hypothetical protein NDU88_006173 [Pleurodeles waltl]|uniref:Uncharacterized protein n=1 Tax=Pleurodeles waltl TaxID=8319 RepID=A0AAV7LRP0_PLEWA|nr:hypothetical protein NDU88_006173 [Pleurodeles waltl]
MLKPPLLNPDRAQKKIDGSENQSDPAPTRTPTAPSLELTGMQVIGPANQGIVSASADAEIATAPRI